MLHDFPFQEGFFFTGRQTTDRDKKQGIDGSYAAALTRQIARAEYYYLYLLAAGQCAETRRSASRRRE